MTARRKLKKPTPARDLLGDPIKPKRNRHEELIQKAIVKMWKIVAHPRAELLGIDVGAPVKLARMRKVALGAVAGWPDITMALPDGRIAFMEVKAADGDLDPKQIAFRDRCAANGWLWALVRSTDDAMAAWVRWGAVRVLAPGRMAA